MSTHSQHPSPADRTLDPADWEAFRALAHRVVDDMIDYVRDVRERPVWQPVPAEVRETLSAPPPREGRAAEDVYDDVRRYILPYPTGNLHPRFWGWVKGTGTPVAMLAELIAAGMNTHMAGFEQAPALVEREVLAWFIELMGFPAASSGLLVSGGTAANMTGLAVARTAKAGFDVFHEGVQSDARAPMLAYCSAETHSWTLKSMALLGLGADALRRIPVDDAYRIDLDALRARIHADRAAGAHPFCVIGNAGTVNTGATDDLRALAEIARAENLWFHIDGAFGALAALSPALRPALAGLELADSLAFDLHKWGYLPYEIGCVLVRDPEAHRRTFSVSPDYLTTLSRGIIAGGLTFADLGLELSRGFKALKVWMSLETHGVDGWRAMIEQNVAQARYLASLVEAEPRLELMAPVALNIVCFRYHAPEMSEPERDDLNEELLLRIQERGIAVPSSTRLDGRFALRVAIVNQRSRHEDFRFLVEQVLATGATLEREHAVARRG